MYNILLLMNNIDFVHITKTGGTLLKIGVYKIILIGDTIKKIFLKKEDILSTGKEEWR